MTRISAWMAIAVGLLLAVGQIARNYDNLANWPSWSIDLVSAGILVTGGVLTLRNGMSRALATGWSFAGGLYVSALINHAHNLQAAMDPGQAAASERLVIIISGLLAAIGVGLALTLFDPKRSGASHA
jgi:hypothetical protein